VAKIFISEIQPNQEVATSFIVTEKQLRVARNGTQFLTLKLSDKTGEITGRVWERAEEIGQTLCSKGVVFCRGRSETFREELQLQIQEISPVAVSEIDPSDFLPVCPVSAEILFEKLKKLTAGIKRRSLHQLMIHVFGDRELMARFKRAPAAKSMHHAYLGGLLEHTVFVVSLVSQICKHYPDLDRDLLIAGAVFHDLGKVEEFVYDLYIDYSHAGRLLGHIVLGVQIFEEKIGGLKSFPEGDALLLKHLILSHHGQTDLGAVRLPMTKEAFVLHFADDLDAKMNSLTRILSESKGADEAWTSYQPMYERFFFKGLPQAAEDGKSIAASPDMQEEDQGGQLSLWQQMEKKRKVDA
jgi:3'-5' exoribonuclease